MVDRYDEDWSRLPASCSRAEILDAGPEHDQVQTALRARYTQLAAMRIDHAAGWGRLGVN